MLENIVQWLAVQPAGPVLVALMADRLWPRRSARPPAAVRRLAGGLVARLNRSGRPAGDRQNRGLLLWGAVTLAAFALGTLAAAGLNHFGLRWLPLVAGGLLLAAGIGYQGARSAARRAVEGVAGLPPAQAGRVGAVAAARLATRFTEGAVALPLAFLLFGLPGLFAVKAGQWLVFAVEDDREGAFGRAVRACHGLVLAPAGVLAALLIGLGRRPRLALAPVPAVAALDGGLDRAGLATAPPAARLQGARVMVDRAHALWLVLLALGSVGAGLL
ncbi:hypothetical protein [Zavarzinia compransoris]|uniref:Cobalamin biosynthesis protein CobD n=1 Tax=Zavarzinia compransoris TaxID=1264899 RepID=A0A317E4X4_9PROT|nr:hypothetical protein [Zavarzinia compransoris]PWR22117.1 hypothetical protein DKG75_09085 [Zavarzinia compransoris]TDP47137.1 hypothetical protein DES42_103307 [Zavarzinia compransoris]